MKNESYNNMVNTAKARNFFLHVLKNEGRHCIISEDHINSLADILAKKLVEKIEKEKIK